MDGQGYPGADSGDWAGAGGVQQRLGERGFSAVCLFWVAFDLERDGRDALGFIRSFIRSLCPSPERGRR
jgi:hypothetical protein